MNHGTTTTVSGYSLIIFVFIVGMSYTFIVLYRILFANLDYWISDSKTFHHWRTCEINNSLGEKICCSISLEVHGKSKMDYLNSWDYRSVASVEGYVSGTPKIVFLPV